MKKEIYNYLNQYKDLYDNDLILSDNFKFLKNELDKKNNSLKKCSKCLSTKKKVHSLFGIGNFKSNIVFIAKAFDKNQDLSQTPSINRSGKLFEKILLAINLKKDDVYIINISNYNSYENDSSFKRETEVCNSCLKKQLKNISPRLIVSLGQLTTEALLDNKENFTDLKDQIHSYDNIDFLVTYHPEDLLKNPELKKHTWTDFKYIRDNYLDGSN